MRKYVDEELLQQVKEEITPIKGTDYFTQEDKEELINAILEALPNAEVGEF